MKYEREESIDTLVCLCT